VKADTSVIRDQTQLVWIHSHIAGIHARAGRAFEARASYEQAAAVGLKVADAQPGDREIRSQLTAVYLDLADLQCANGKPSDALPWVDKAVAIERKCFEVEPSQPENRGALADRIRRRGIVLQRCGRSAEAVEAFRGSIILLKGTANPRPVDIYDIACCQSLLSGVASERGSGLTAADGRAEADRAIETLRRSVAAGWSRAAHMRVDSDLDPIRSRPGFQLLMMDLTMPAHPFASP
jgi:eukaryotic-like serine/threonine-protein kinase